MSESQGVVPEQAAAWLEPLAIRARDYARQAKAENTRRAYSGDWQHFLSWCWTRQLDALPAHPTTLCLYVSELAGSGLRVSTIQRRLAAISQAHQAGGHIPSPTWDWRVRQVMSGIRRELGVRGKPKRAITTPELQRLLAAMPADLSGIRDRALLLLGFAGSFRRSELAALRVEDLEETEEGLEVQLGRSKSDPEGQGQVVGIVRGQKPGSCPVRALRAWLEASGVAEGPLFRRVDRHGRLLGPLSGRAVALVVKRACSRAGIDPDTYAGHSLRSGHATAAARGHAPERAIARQTGHRSLQMLRRYVQQGTLFEENSSAYLGL